MGAWVLAHRACGFLCSVCPQEWLRKNDFGSHSLNPRESGNFRVSFSFLLLFPPLHSSSLFSSFLPSFLLLFLCPINQCASHPFSSVAPWVIFLYLSARCDFYQWWASKAQLLAASEPPDFWENNWADGLMSMCIRRTGTQVVWGDEREGRRWDK